MTTRTVYVPRLIESAEQAEALPDGSMAYLDDTDAYGKPSRSVASKHRGAWWVDDRRDSVVGWTALVPIEAEEESTARVQGFAGVFHVSRSTGSFPTPQHRLVTPWEEA